METTYIDTLFEKRPAVIAEHIRFVEQYIREFLLIVLERDCGFPAGIHASDVTEEVLKENGVEIQSGKHGFESTLWVEQHGKRVGPKLYMSILSDSGPLRIWSMY